MTTHCRIIKPKTDAADCRSRRVKVTVPDEFQGNALQDAVRDSLSPLTMAAVVVILLSAKIGSPRVDGEVR